MDLQKQPAISQDLLRHLQHHKCDETRVHSLASLQISKPLTTFIRNLQEKTHGCGVFVDTIHQNFIAKVAQSVRLKLKDPLKNDQLEIRQMHFSYNENNKQQSEKLQLFHPQELNWERMSNVVACILTVSHHQDTQTWNHDVLALVVNTKEISKEIYYFDFNDSGYYTKDIEQYFTSVLPGYHFKAMISFAVLLPDHTHLKDEVLAMQEGNEVK